jgi:hypothetical protein
MDTGSDVPQFSANGGGISVSGEELGKAGGCGDRLPDECIRLTLLFFPNFYT